MADTNGLIRFENEALTAMMNVRYALDQWEAPKPRDLDIIVKSVAHFVELAKQLQAQDEKEEAERQREYDE